MKRTILISMMSLAVFAQGGFRGNGSYEIMSPLSQKVLDLDRNDQRTVIQFESRRTDNQRWDVIDAGGGYFYLRNGMNGYALAVQDDRNSTPLIGEPFNQTARQQWRIDSGDNGTAILVNRNGKAIDIPYGSTNNGVKINSYNRNNEVNQRWQFIEVRGGNYTSGGNSRYDTPGQYGTPGQYPTTRDDRRRPGRYDTNTTNNPTTGNYGAGQTPADGVCFYSDRDFQGQQYCLGIADDTRQLSAPFAFSSIRFFGRARAVQVFDREGFRGNSNEITGDQRMLGNRVTRRTPRSVRVY